MAGGSRSTWRTSGVQTVVEKPSRMTQLIYPVGRRLPASAEVLGYDFSESERPSVHRDSRAREYVAVGDPVEILLGG